MGAADQQHRVTAGVARWKRVNCDTLLYRQVHPGFVHNGRVTSQAFKPDADRELSVYDGDQISAEDSWLHYTGHLNLKSVGVMAVSVGECRNEQLCIRPDPKCDFEEHVLIMFDDGLQRIAKRLKAHAVRRDWQYRP